MDLGSFGRKIPVLHALRSQHHPFPLQTGLTVHGLQFKAKRQSRGCKTSIEWLLGQPHILLLVVQALNWACTDEIAAALPGYCTQESHAYGMPNSPRSAAMLGHFTWQRLFAWLLHNCTLCPSFCDLSGKTMDKACSFEALFFRSGREMTNLGGKKKEMGNNSLFTGGLNSSLFFSEGHCRSWAL